MWFRIVFENTKIQILIDLVKIKPSNRYKILCTVKIVVSVFIKVAIKRLKRFESRCLLWIFILTSKKNWLSVKLIELTTFKLLFFRSKGFAYYSITLKNQIIVKPYRNIDFLDNYEKQLVAIIFFQSKCFEPSRRN